MSRLPLLALALLTLSPAALAVADLRNLENLYSVLQPDPECDANGCYVEVCLKADCYRLYIPTAVCLNVANAPHSVTVGVGNPTRPGGCFLSEDVTLA